MDGDTFWKTTPRKFFALLEAHNRANSSDEDDKKSTHNTEKAEPVTLEELKAWAKKR